MGEIYVQVDASVANGITMLNASGGGEEGGSYWIQWHNDSGFAGTGWEFAWKSSNTPLQENWTKYPAEGYEGTYEEFLRYVSTASDLNNWLGDSWSDNAKKAFIDEGDPIIWNDCTRPA